MNDLTRASGFQDGEHGLAQRGMLYIGADASRAGVKANTVKPGKRVTKTSPREVKNDAPPAFSSCGHLTTSTSTGFDAMPLAMTAK
jgi:hypothetical protein